MEEYMRKLGLWQTRTFNPIMTHDELEPLMAVMGFVGLPPSNAWKEYAYHAKPLSVDQSPPLSSPPPSPPPRPKLPYPRIDGLHIYTYQAFIDAVSFYLDMPDVSDLFHIRGMPLHRTHDRTRKWRRMEEDNVFVYREGTLDQTMYNLYHSDKQRSNGYKSIVIREKGNSTPINCVVSLKDVIVLLS